LNRLAKIALIIVIILFAIYTIYFYISPSVTVINKSGEDVLESNIRLPNSNLDFGSILSEQKNTIHYDLSQNDGSYYYTFKLSNITLSGSCGYITSSEINKRVMIVINENREVVCE